MIGSESESALTAEVEVDASGDLSILVLGFHFVKSSVGLDDIIEFQNHRVLVLPVLVHVDPGSAVLHYRHVLPEPHHVRLGTGNEKVFSLASSFVLFLIFYQVQLEQKYVEKGKRKVEHAIWRSGHLVVLVLQSFATASTIVFNSNLPKECSFLVKKVKKGF